MANGIFNVAKGRIRTYAELGAASDALIVVLLKSSGLEADATLADHDTLSALLAATNDECDFTNYSRKTLANVSNAVDDTNNWYDGDADDFTYTSAGGATNNTIGKAIVCYDDNTGAGTDANIVPVSYHDFTATTDGNDLVVTVATGGFLRAQ